MLDAPHSMNRRCLLTCAAAALLGLGACAVPGGAPDLRIGISQQEDIVLRHGKPSRIWSEPDGGSTLEYATQPFGETCWMFRLDAAGKLVEFHDALQPDVRDQVRAGQTMDQVSRLLGREYQRVYFRFSGEEVWDWKVPSDQKGVLLRFNVHFKQGTVHRTSYSLSTHGRARTRLD
jgi:hypothetical protein